MMIIVRNMDVSMVVVRRIVRAMCNSMSFAETLFAMKHQEIQTERIEGSNENAGHHCKVGKARPGKMRQRHRFYDAVFGIETG